MKRWIIIFLMGSFFSLLTGCTASNIIDESMKGVYKGQENFFYLLQNNNYKIENISNLKVGTDEKSLEFQLNNVFVKYHYLFEDGFVIFIGQDLMSLSVRNFNKDDINDLSNLISNFYKDEVLNGYTKESLMKYQNNKEASFHIFDKKVYVKIKDGDIFVECKSKDYTK